jgi:hypothetical protein
MIENSELILRLNQKYDEVSDILDSLEPSEIREDFEMFLKGKLSCLSDVLEWCGEIPERMLK